MKQYNPNTREKDEINIEKVLYTHLFLMIRNEAVNAQGHSSFLTALFLALAVAVGTRRAPSFRPTCFRPTFFVHSISSNPIRLR